MTLEMSIPSRYFLFLFQAKEGVHELTQKALVQSPLVEGHAVMIGSLGFSNEVRHISRYVATCIDDCLQIPGNSPVICDWSLVAVRVVSFLRVLPIELNKCDDAQLSVDCVLQKKGKQLAEDAKTNTQFFPTEPL